MFIITDTILCVWKDFDEISALTLPYDLDLDFSFSRSHCHLG